MKKFYIVLLLLILFIRALPQNGFPYIKNYTANDYLAPGQIWTIGQGKDGLMYFGGDLGLYIFNGEQWYKYKFESPNGFPVRSLLIAGDTIFVAGLGDFGYLFPDGKSFNYISLATELDSTYRLSFTNVWRVKRTGQFILFQADTIIFRYNINNYHLDKLISGELYRFLNKVNGKVYFASKSNIYEYDGRYNKLKKYPNDGNEIFNFLPYRPDTLIICNRSKLKFLSLKTGKIFQTPALIQLNNYFKGLFIYTANFISNKNLYAFGTIEKGLFLVDKNLKIYLHIDKKDGILSHSVLYTYQDQQGDLWLAGSNGISVLNMSLPFQIYDSRQGLDGNPYDIAQYKGHLFVATHLNLYEYNTQKNKFIPIYTDKGKYILQPFYIDTVRFSDGRTFLLISSADGLFYLDNNNVAKKLTKDVAYSFKYFRNFPDTIYYTTGYELKKIIYHNGHFSKAIPMYIFNSLYVEGEPQNHYIWLFDEYSTNVIRFDALTYKFNKYKAPVKINQGQYIDDSLYIFTSEKGLYSFDGMQGRFLQSSFILNNFFADKYLNEIFPIGHNQYVTYSYNNQVSTLYRVKVNNNKIVIDSSIFNIVKTFYRIRVIGRDVWILTYNDFVRYNLNSPPLPKYSLFPKIFKIYKPNGHIIYSYPQKLKHRLGTIKYPDNSIIIEFALPSYVASGSPQFSYRLVHNGYGKWSSWSSENKVQLLSLREGKYTFELRAHDALGRESNTVFLNFRIKPPFYRSLLAYLVYLLLFISILALFIKIRDKKLKRDKIRLKNIIAQKTHELEKQRQQIQIQNENIRTLKDTLQQRTEQVSSLISKIQIADQKIIVQNNHIADSIEYAKRIQKSILSRNEYLKRYFREWFVFFEPKEFVSGDFYWTEKIDAKLYIAVADCTGHALPGAFLSVLSYSLLNQIILKGVTSTADLLEKLRNELIKIFTPSQDDDFMNREGMDIALISIDLKSHELEFSGAYNPLVIIHSSGELIEMKGDRMYVGYMPELKHFTVQKYKIHNGDKFYMFTDGYYDQINYKTNHKFYRKNFYALLQKIAPLPMTEQYQILKSEFYKWRGDALQVDDVLVMGLKLDLSLLK